MKITQDVREYARGLEEDGLTIEEGMKQKSEEFINAGAQIYVTEVH
jgi:hypothetical protein